MFSILVPPCYSRYSHHTGEIEDYGPEDFKKGKTSNVYTYYKLLYDPNEPSDPPQEVTW